MLMQIHLLNLPPLFGTVYLLIKSSSSPHSFRTKLLNFSPNVIEPNLIFFLRHNYHLLQYHHFYYIV